MLRHTGYLGNCRGEAADPQQTLPGNHVYDPFMSSGTTLMAAELTGRVCHGIEIDPGYCDVTIRRWEKYA